VGLDPCALEHRRPKPERQPIRHQPRPVVRRPSVHSGPANARRGQSWHRRPSRPTRDRPRSDGVEPGHTISIEGSIDECACC